MWGRARCPYYVSRELHARADIIFMPYNYLLEKEQRKSLKGIQWEDSVIIFDEAHNLVTTITRNP